MNERVPESGSEKKDESKLQPAEAVYGRSMEQAVFVEMPNGQLSYRTHKGIGYKDRNEDAIVVFPGKDSFCVIDGMGGYSGGDVAAQIVAEAMKDGLATQQSFDDIRQIASKKLANHFQNAEDPRDKKNGACYAACRIIDGVLHVGYQGDVRVMVIRKGKVVFTTEDQGIREWNERHVVLGPVTAKSHGDLHEATFSLRPGDTIVAGSDGLTDNFDQPVEQTTANGTVKIKDQNAGNRNIASFLENNMGVAEYTQELTKEAMERMRIFSNATQKNQLTYKPDNISVLVYRYQQETKTLGDRYHDLADAVGETVNGWGGKFTGLAKKAKERFQSLEFRKQLKTRKIFGKSLGNLWMLFFLVWEPARRCAG